jgi:acetoin utilization deacetylase AcuC-like enzyme
MKCAYHEGYAVPLSPGHPFPMSKYPLLRDRLLMEGLLSGTDTLEPEPLDVDTLSLAHARDYLDKLATSNLSTNEQRRLGLPWSDALWRRSRLAASGTLLAARVALAEGMAANLAGGTHHAFADRGEGFCVLNDVAIAILRLRAEGLIRRALVIDLDVHQGNGTAAIFSGDAAVYTFSMHGERNYPAVKMRSSLDVGLVDGTGDADYLAALGVHLPAVLEAAQADMAFYVAGVDVVDGDRYGKLALSEAGLAAREQLVVTAVRERGTPLVIVLGGGYAATRERTADLHVHVFRAAVNYERRAAKPGCSFP